MSCKFFTFFTFSLIIKRIPLHPKIHQFYEEYSFNKAKCYHVTLQIEKLKMELQEKFGETHVETKDEKVQEKTTETEQPKETEETPKTHLPEITVSSEENQEIQQIIEMTTEKQKIKVKPLPGISNFSCCKGETIKRLEEQKRLLEIYKEIRGLRRRYRNSLIEVKKKISENERRKSENVQKKEEEKPVEKKETFVEKKERVEEMDQRLQDFMGETIEGTRTVNPTENQDTNKVKTTVIEEKPVETEESKVETPQNNTLEYDKNDINIPEHDTDDQKGSINQINVVSTAPIEIKKQVPKVDDDFFASESLDKIPEKKKDIDQDIDEFFN